MSEGLPWKAVRAYLSGITCARLFIASGEIDTAAVVLDASRQDLVAELAAAGELREKGRFGGMWYGEIEELLDRLREEA
jgi:hypothetical protein